MPWLRPCHFPLPSHHILRQHVLPIQHLCKSTSTSFPILRSIGVPTSKSLEKQAVQHPYPVTPACPPPTCPCGEMPIGLDIDYKKPLQGTMPHYTQHIAIRTGQDNWTSRIENGGIGEKKINLARELKELVGPKGKYHDVCTRTGRRGESDAMLLNSQKPYRNILITNTSFRHIPGGPVGRDVLLFPQCSTVIKVGETPESIEAFVKQFLIPKDNCLSEKGQPETYNVDQVRSLPTILICGHGGRDQRCGVLGPLLRGEFVGYIRRLLDDADGRQQTRRALRRKAGQDHAQEHLERVPFRARVGLCSHIGGHAWAGNVIVYLPPDHRLEDGALSPLAGKGVWYGRVEPKHVEGIMEETVGKGRVIEKLLRGVHSGPEVDARAEHLIRSIELRP